MSAILAAFGPAADLTDSDVRRMLRAMQTRGADHVEVVRVEGATLAVARHPWELDRAFSGPVLVARDEHRIVAADAAVYYRADLRARLETAGVRPVADTAAHLILAAFAAWGDDCTDHIEGDFAFIAWDRTRRRALAARDFGGKRPLHYAQVGRGLVLASNIGAVLDHPDCPAELDPVHLGATAAGLFFSAGPGTCYRAIRVLPAAHTLAWQADATRTEPRRHWDPLRLAGTGEPEPHVEAAERLRHMLRRACVERMPADAVTAVWMSGGWDSTAVFAAAQEATRLAGSRLPTHAVSISYPEGDPGREDGLIEEVAAFWGASVHWLDIGDIPLLDQPEHGAALRDQPYAHLYEHWNRALARGARDCGARVALDGNGGDQLFQTTDVFLADLARSGRWIRLLREWRARDRGGFREFFGAAIQPNLPGPALRMAAVLRGGRRLRHYLERRLPEWIDADFARRHHLVERDFEYLGRPGAPSHSVREMDWILGNPFITRAFSYLGEYALDAGIELRSPLTDRRIVEFAFQRPWWERSSGADTKLLLRRSMRGALPDGILATRPYRTGITSGYSHRWMRDVFPALLESTLQAPLCLERLGVVRTERLREAARDYPRTGDAWTRVNLFYTLQTELWLRAHEHRKEPAIPSHPDPMAGMMQ